MLKLTQNKLNKQGGVSNATPTHHQYVSSKAQSDAGEASFLKKLSKQ
jgi:hypothetical protein